MTLDMTLDLLFVFCIYFKKNMGKALPTVVFLFILTQYKELLTLGVVVGTPNLA